MENFEPPFPIDNFAKELGITKIDRKWYDVYTGSLKGNKISASVFDLKVRQNYTIAHELGHYLLHSNKEYLDKDLIYEMLIEVPSKNLYGMLYYDKKERQENYEADLFAVNVLTPENKIKEEWRNAKYTRTEDVVYCLASSFRVHKTFMVKRLLDLGIIDGWMWIK